MMAGKSIFFGVVGLVAGLALGVSMGQLFPKPPRAEHSPSAPVREMSRGVVQSTAAATTPGSEEVAKRSETIAPFEKLRELCADTQECDVGQCLVLIKGLSAAECREAVTLFRRLPQGESALLTQALARRWASLDANGVLEEAVRMNDRSSGQIFALEGARALVARDPEAALAKLTARGDALYRLFLGRPILSALAERDPARAAAFLKGRPEFRIDGDLYGILAVKWSQHDLQQALKWSKELPAGRSRAEAMKGVGQVWAEQDPAAMAAEISRARLEWDREVVTAVAQNWSKRDPRAAIDWIESLPVKEDRDAAWRRFRLDTTQLGTEAMLEVVSAMPDVSWRGNIVNMAASELARKDVRAALSLTESLPEGLRPQALRYVIDQWAEREPEAAVRYLTGLPESERRDALRRAVSSWAVRDTSAAMNWTRQLPVSEERDQVVAQVAGGLRQFDPAAAAQWIDLMGTHGNRAHLIQETVGSWAGTDPVAATRWLSQFPEGAQNAEAHFQIARQWALADAEGSANWIGTLQAGPTRDAAIRAFVKSVDGYDAGLATTWATAIEDPRQRRESLTSAFNRWLESDGAQAQAWLAGAQLSEDLRAELARVAEMRRTGK
jgi:hypothetical protein